MKKLFKDVIESIPSSGSKTFSNNEVIVGAGKEQKDCYYLTDGFVKVYDLNADGNIKTIALLKSGDMFPIVWGFDHPPETVYYYKAMGKVRAISVETVKLKSAIENDMQALKSAHSAFVYLTWDLMERIKCLQMPYTQEKLIRLMPYLAAKLGKEIAKNKYELKQSITQEEIAQLLGATRESVSSHLSNLEKKGIIKRYKSSFIINISEIPSEYIHEIWFGKQSE